MKIQTSNHISLYSQLNKSPQRGTTIPNFGASSGCLDTDRFSYSQKQQPAIETDENLKNDFNKLVKSMSIMMNCTTDDKFFIPFFDFFKSLNEQDAKDCLNAVCKTIRMTNRRYSPWPEDEIIRICDKNLYENNIPQQQVFDYTRKFLDNGILPQNYICDAYTKNPEKVLKEIKCYRDKGLQFLGFYDKYAVDEILLNPNSKIKKDLLALPDKKYSQFTTGENPFDENWFDVILDTPDGTEQLKLNYDKNTQNLIYSQKTKNYPNGNIVKITDFPQSGNKIKQEYSNGILKNMLKITANGVTYYKKSTINGQYDIYHIDNQGKKNIISQAERDQNTGIETITKNFVSSAGVKTNYKYIEHPNGDFKFFYKITDKDGTELMNLNRKFKVLDGNHFSHTINDKTYDVLFTKDTIEITDYDDKKTILNLNELIPEKKENIIKILKKLPAEELLKCNNDYKRFFVELDRGYAFADYTKDAAKILVGPNVFNAKYAPFVCLHELGHVFHSYDVPKKQNDEMYKTYQKERQKYLDKTFASEDSEPMKYIITNAWQPLTYFSLYGACDEAFADVYAILKAVNFDDKTAERPLILMQHFPETIAKSAEIENLKFDGKYE